ncbi:trigger factor, partial [Staphylococcus aureus]|uniref:trigger factor n=1 Tax=Staphylococcus aureus TaxID=1280 RepID=UPI0039BEC463
MTITNKTDKDTCRCLVSFSFEKEIVHKVIDSIAQEACKTAKFPGFRPGKATPDVAKVFAKKQILEYAKQQLAQDAYDEILYETKWKQS